MSDACIGKIEYWRGKSLVVDYIGKESIVRQIIEKLINEKQIIDAKDVDAIINELLNINKVDINTIKNTLLKWQCYCTDGKLNNNEKCHEKIFNTIKFILDNWDKKRTRSNASTGEKNVKKKFEPRKLLKPFEKRPKQRPLTGVIKRSRSFKTKKRKAKINQIKNENPEQKYIKMSILRF